MSERATIGTALGGAWRLFLQDPRGLEAFDMSHDGFMRSFMALVLAVPLALVTFSLEAATLRAANIQVPDPQMGFYLVETAAFALRWLAFPVAMVYVTRLLHMTAAYVPLVIAFNWCALLIVLIAMPAQILFALGIISVEILLLFDLVIFSVGLYYRWFALRTAVGGHGVTVAGFVMLHLLLSLFITLGADAVHGWPGEIVIP